MQSEDGGEKMGGWKVKVGSFCTAAGGVLVASGMKCPLPEASPWLEWAGGVVLSIGLAMTGYGLGHKIEKGAR